jgi:hypothetical protein
LEENPNGLVYRAPTTVIVVHRKDSYTADPARAGRHCKTETTHETLTLPLGDAYAVNIDDSTSWFASNEFSMSFNDQGVLKQVTLNSDPQLDETLTATAALVKEVAAVAGPAAVGLMALDKPAGGKCGDFIESKVVCTKTAEAWVADPHCPAAP